MENLKLTVLGTHSATEVLRQIGMKFENYNGFRPVEVDSDKEIIEVCEKMISESDNNTIALVTYTELYSDNEKIGVPADAEEAGEMLKRLSGKSHYFVTRLCIGGAQQPPEVVTVKTTVVMKELEEREIKGYLTKCDFTYPGAYNPIGKGSFFVRSVLGDYNNIKGMPVSALTGLLESKYGVTLVNGKNIW